MGKKAKDEAAASKKEVKVKQPKVKAPVDPVQTKKLIRLLNTLALILAIVAFLFQLIAVLSHHWKWQKVDLGSIMSQNQGQTSVHEDSNLYQNFGLFSREVKLFANNDEQLDVLGSTRFPRIDDGEEALHQCLSQTSTLRGVFLACSKQVSSPNACHCRRHPYWNAVIFFEIAALILLGIAVFLVALLSTEFHALLKPAAAGLALLAFLFLFIGLILILSYRKRETRSFADAYPHIYNRLANKIHATHEAHRKLKRSPSLLHQALRRQTNDIYRAYPLLHGQYPFNATHYTEYSDQARAWLYIPYSSVSIAPLSPREQVQPGAGPEESSTTAAPTPAYGAYGPLLGYDSVFNHTDAGIGWSTVLSIFALLFALLTGLLLLLSWLKNKSLEPDSKKVVSTTGKNEYVALPQDITLENAKTPLIPTEYDPRRPIGDAVVAAQNIGQGTFTTSVNPPEPVIVRDVIIRDEPVPQVIPQQTFPVTIETTQTVHHA